MNSIEKIIAGILGASPELKVGIQEARILDLWAPSVGAQISKHTKAVQLRDQVLFVVVDHPIWKQELNANKTFALKKLNEKIETTLGPSPEQLWIKDIILMSPNPANESQAKGKSKFRKK